MFRKIAVTTTVGVLLLAGSQAAFAQFGGLTNVVSNGASSLLGGGAPAGNMKANAQAFALYMNVGTYHLTEAVARMERAIGHADNAKALEAQAEYIKKAGTAATADDYSKTYQMVDQSNINRDELAKVPDARGKAELGQSSLHLAVGALEDKKAITLAQSLTGYRPSAQDALDGSILTMVNVASLAVNVLPGHVDKTATWMGYLNDYFSSHKITPPSDEEKKKVAAEDLPADQANALFASQ